MCLLRYEEDVAGANYFHRKCFEIQKIFSEKAFSDLLGDVKKRLENYDASTCGFTVEPKIRNIAAYLMERNADKTKGSKRIKARQHNQLMMVICSKSVYQR